MNAMEYALMDTIRKAGLPTGAHFLSDKLKIPPATIGRVLNSLEQEGLLEKVSNKGRQLTGKGHRHMAKQDELNSQKETLNNIIYMMNDAQKDKLLDILQARILLECYTAEMACKNATESALRRLNALMLEYLYEVRQYGVASEQNLQMHLVIAEMAGNQTVLQLLKLILMNEHIYSEFSSITRKSHKDQLIMHSRIVEAISSRNAQAAVQAMRQHLEQIAFDVNNNGQSGAEG